MTPLELNINRTPRVFDLIAGADKPIVKDHDQNAQNNETENNDHHCMTPPFDSIGPIRTIANCAADD
jgi:hypothetical protein